MNKIVIEKMQVLIGEQASGKDTICKIVYYCLKFGIIRLVS